MILREKHPLRLALLALLALPARTFADCTSPLLAGSVPMHGQKSDLYGGIYSTFLNGSQPITVFAGPEKFNAAGPRIDLSDTRGPNRVNGGALEPCSRAPLNIVPPPRRKVARDPAAKLPLAPVALPPVGPN